jgi:hypothetical protein
VIKTVDISMRIPMTVAFITSLLTSDGSDGTAVEKSKFE